MNKGIFFALIVLFFSLNVFAENKKESVNTIPFVINQVASMNEAAKLHYGLSADSNIKDIPVAEVQNLVVSIRQAVCGSIGDGSIKVWITVGAKGKVGIVASAFAHTGLEVNMNCSQIKNKK